MLQNVSKLTNFLQFSLFLFKYSLLFSFESIKPVYNDIHKSLKLIAFDNHFVGRVSSLTAG